MKRNIQVWGSRTFALLIFVLGANHWGIPLYKQYMTPKKSEVYIPATKVREGKFTISFQEIGTLEAERSVVVNSDINGKIISLVADGKVVSAGDQIAILDTTELEHEVRNQLLEYQNRMADVDRARVELDILKESNATDLTQQQAQLEYDENELKLANEDLAKKERLFQEKLVTGAQVDQARGVVRSKELAVAKGKADLEFKHKEVEAKEKQKAAEIRNVEFRADMAKSTLDQTEGRLKSAIIHAPASGLVVIASNWFPDGRRKLQDGDSVRPQQSICSLPDLSSMLVKIQVGEADAPRVSVGMSVLIRLEAVPDKIYHGSVKSISSLATETSPWEGGTPGKKNFQVIVAVKENDPKVIKPGMTANVEFICEVLDKVLYVPLESVVEVRGKTYVFVKKNSRYERVEVKTGKYNDNHIIITGDVRAGQEIALRDPTRDLEQQEAGSSAPGAEKNKQKEAAPIPGADRE